MTAFFSIKLDDHECSALSSVAATGETVLFERVDADCCGCCTGTRRTRDSYDRPYRGINSGAGAVVGGAFFVTAAVSMILVAMLVWSIDSAGDVVDESVEIGSGI